MPERVLEPNEISLNAVKYRIQGPVKSFVASVYPEKQVFGSYTEDSNPDVSVVSWTDFTGGVGLYRIRNEDDLRRSYVSGLMTHRQGEVIQAPQVITIGIGGELTGTASWLGELPTGSSNAGELYAVGSDKKIYKYASTNDTWGTNVATLTSTVTDVCNAEINGSYYLVFACNSANTAYSTNGTSWTDNAQDSLYVCYWNDQLWGITVAGQLWRTTDLSTFTNDAKLPTGAGSVKGLVVGPDASGEPIIYAVTNQGLYAHDFANTKFWLTGFTGTTGVYYAKPCEWNGWICIPIDDVVWMYRASTGDIVATSPALPDGFATTADSDLGANLASGPYILSVSSQGNRLFALSGDTAAGQAYAINYFDGKGWHGMFWGAAYAGGMKRIITSYAYGAHRLWIVNDAATYSRITYIALPTFTGLYVPYTSTGIITTPWFDGFDAMATKTALRVHVNVKDASANDTTVVKYGLNYTRSGATSLGTITTNGVTTYNFPDSTTPTGTNFRAIRFSVTLNSIDGTYVTPALISVALEYRKKPTIRMGFETDVDLTQGYAGRSVEELRAALVTATASTTKVEFTFRDDTALATNRNYYVDVKVRASVEQTGLNEQGITHLVLVET